MSRELVGLALLGFGIGVQLHNLAITDIIQGNFEVAPISAMVIGSIAFLVAFFGCCGAIRESNCVLVTYAIFMLILMILKIGLAIMIFMKLDAFVDDIPRWLNEAFSYNLAAFHNIEATFQCCGVTGPESYFMIGPFLPPSCCAVGLCNLFNAYQGCKYILHYFFNTFGLTTGFVTLGIGAIELVAVVFALYLANHARNKTTIPR